MVKIIAGPCILQSEKDVQLAKTLKDLGADVFRAKMYRAEGTHPPDKVRGYLSANAMRWFGEIKEFMPIATEVSQKFPLHDWFDYIWLPARQMQNYAALKSLNFEKRKGIILKRHFGCTLDEWLGASEYLPDCEVIFCERGTVSFDRRPNSDMRWRPDILAIAELKQMGKTVCFDATHSVCNSRFVIPMARAAVAAGADMIMVEVRENMEESWSDKTWGINLTQFEQLVKEIK